MSACGDSLKTTRSRQSITSRQCSTGTTGTTSSARCSHTMVGGRISSATSRPLPATTTPRFFHYHIPTRRSPTSRPGGTGYRRGRSSNVRLSRGPDPYPGVPRGLTGSGARDHPCPAGCPQTCPGTGRFDQMSDGDRADHAGTAKRGIQDRRDPAF